MSINKQFQISVTTDSISALDLLEKGFLTEAITLSRQGIKQVMQKGCVWLENGEFIQRLRRAKKILRRGEILHCYYNEDVLNTIPKAAKLVSDEGDYSIWDKPSGMLSQGSKWGDHCTVYRWSEQNLKPERPAFIVHRLDRAASGLIIIAHKKKIAAKFAEMFKQQQIEKHYAVKVEGDFSQFSDFKNEVTTLSAELDGKAAISHIQLLEFDSETKISLLDVAIETGRKHQIRKHLLEAGFPVVGDRLYGSSKENLVDLQLRAKSLKFECPIEKIGKSYNI